MKVRAAIKHSKLKEYVCMPSAANLEKLFSVEVLLKQHSEWKIVPCPMCGRECIDGIFKKEKDAGPCICTRCAEKAAKQDYIRAETKIRRER